MNKKTLCKSPVAIAIMSMCINVSAQTVSTNQNTAINSQASTDITINDNITVDVTGEAAITIDDSTITLNVNSGASVLSDQIAVDVQPTPDPNSGDISDPVINNNGIINGDTIGIRLDRDANADGEGSLVNINNSANSLIVGGNRAIEIEADTIDLDNSGTITLGAPNAASTNGVIFVSDQASNVDIFNRDGGIIDAGDGAEAAGISLQLNNGGRRNDITNDDGGEIIGRGDASASGSDAGDGIRFERERELSSGQDSSGNSLEDIGTLQSTTEQFLSQGNVNNAGLISSEGANGTVAGIRVVDNVAFSGTITNESTGTITGEQNGLYFGNADHRDVDDLTGDVESTGTVSNAGTISSGSRALNIDGSNLQITNEVGGQIIGTGDQRNGTVYADSTAQDFSLNNDGLIDAGVGNSGAGFSVELSEEGNDFSINNTGTIQGRGAEDAGSATAGDGIRLERTRVSGALDGSTTGLFTGSITNSGTIASESMVGTTAGLRTVDNVSFQGSIDNQTSGTISGAQNGLYFGNGDHTGGTASNSGTISSDSRALNIDGTNIVITNEVGGQILGTADQRNGTVYADSTAQDFVLNNDGTIDANAGNGAGFSVELADTGNAFTINNTGTIQGRGAEDAGSATAGDGIRLERTRVSGALDGTTTGLFTGAITNSGTIASESTVGTTAGLRTVDNVNFQGSIDNQTGGTISGAQNGLYFGNGDHTGGTVSNSGTISSDSRALNIDGTNIVITNEVGGQILGTADQRNGTVYADSTAQNFVLNNDGTIDANAGNGAGFSVELADTGNAFTINNIGTIQGRGAEDAGSATAGDGIRLERTRVSGALDGSTTGLFTGAITNSGTIASESTVGTTAGLRTVDNVNFQGSIDNQTGGTISGAQNGLYFGNGDHTGSTVTNAGTISSDSRALNIDGTNIVITNEVGGQILGTADQRNGTVYADSTAQDFVLNNDGTIDANAGNGAGFSVELADTGNAFTINNTGTIQGRGAEDAGSATAGDGIRLERTRVNSALDGTTTGLFTGSITNSGTIASESTVGTTAGLRTVDNVNFQGSIDNQTGGTISGAQNGLYFGNGDHTGSTVTNAGTISSDSRALNIDGSGLNINNSGTILGTGSQRNGTVYADATATDFAFNNLSTGIVDGGQGNDSSAISIQVGDSDSDIQIGSINNEGSLQGRGTGVSAGIRLFTSTAAGATFAGNITNSGNISAEDSAGILIQSGVTLDGEISNTGNISATGGTAVDFSDNGTGITFNQSAGDIDGSILLGTGNDVINISGGSLSADITGQGSGIVNIDIGTGNTFVSNGVSNVQDYNILSGTVTQISDFSTASHTTTVSSGATLAFNSVINGSGALVSNGTLNFGVDGRLIQNGEVTLNQGSTIEFLFGEALALGDQVQLIDALSIVDNGVEIVDNSVLLNLEATFDANGNLIVQTVSANLAADTGLDINTQAFAIAISDAISAGNPLIIANLAEFQSAAIDDLTALAPSLSGAATLGAYQLNDANLKLIRNQYASGNAVSELKNGIWIQGLSGNAEQDDQNNITGFDSDFDGFGIGYSVQLNKLRLGVAYSASDASISNNLTTRVDTDIDSNQIAVYGDYKSGAWFFGGSLSYSDLEYDFNRASTLSGVSAVSANTDGSLFDASINLGYQLDGRLAGLTPIASIAYSSLEIDSFDETGGAGISNVNYSDVDRLRSELGFAFNSNTKYRNWTISPSLKLSWKHDFEDDATAFSADIGGVNFSQLGNELESDVINFGAGLNFSNGNNWNIRVDYQGEFASDEDSQFGSASVEYRF